MRIAVAYENGQVFQHFGHTEQFKIYNAEDGKILSSEIVDTNGSGHGALAGLLSKQKVDVLICRGIGERAQEALVQAGIKVLGGVKGDADKAAESFVVGDLIYDPDVKCDHHHHHGPHHYHGEDHTCGEHGCISCNCAEHSDSGN